jgi:hypothetical protein
MAEVWGAVVVAGVAAVGTYAASRSASKNAKQAQENEIEAQKELARQKRQYQLEDRKYNQDAVGAWGKFLDPALAGPQAFSSESSTAGTVSSEERTEGAVDDPNDPMFQRNPVAQGVNALPLNRAAPFAGARPGFGGAAPSSMSSFKNRNPEYDFFKRPPEE